MLVLRAAVLATAGLHAHAIAVASPKVSPTGPFEEPFEDFYDFDAYDDFDPSVRSAVNSTNPWIPPTRPPSHGGLFPFKGPHREGEGTHWENRLLIVPDKKLAFCYIEKNACTQFNRLVNGLNGKSSKDERPFWKSNSDGNFKRYFEDKRNPISKANGWKIGIFLRDPAERFLSAWLSKCDAWEYGGIDCLGPQVSNRSEDEKVHWFETTVLEVLPKYMASVQKKGSYNAHYDPQHIFCGGRPREEYDFVGELSGSKAHIQQQVVDMLKRGAGIKDSDHQMDLARELFPSTATAGHATGSTNLMKQFYRNRTIYNKVVKLYAEDYRFAYPLFNFPRMAHPDAQPKQK